MNQSGTGAIWVVAADSVRARLFEVRGTDGLMTEVLDLSNPQSRLSDRDLVSDRGGRVRVGGDSSRRHVYGEDNRERTHTRKLFAARIAAALDELRANGRLGRVYLVAEPGFLGVLKSQLTPETRTLVAGSINSGLATSPISEIRATLPLRL
jgi:protein required for attachment to host cells